MTKSEMKATYPARFSHFFLINHEGKTKLAGSQRRPVKGFPVYCYLPMENDFFKLDAADVVCSIKQKSPELPGPDFSSSYKTKL